MPLVIPTLDDIDRELARRSLLEYTVQTHRNYQVARFHEVMCEYLEAWVHGEIRRLIIMAPPRRGKTELVSRRLPAWAMGHYPDQSIMACSYGSTLAKANSRDVQNILTSKRHHEVFPETRISEKGADYDTKRTDDEWHIVGHEGHGYYKCAGVDGGITGRGANRAIVDDPHKNRAEAKSDARRNRAWEFCITDLETRLEPPGCLCIMATRWHPDDVIGRYLETEGRVEEGGLWHVLQFPEYEDGVDKHLRPYDDRPIGAFLWLGRFLEPDEEPEEVEDAELERRATEAMERRQKDPETDAALYQQRPMKSGGNIAKEQWFGNWTTLPPMESRWIVTCDAKAGSKDPNSSRCVFQLWAQPFREPGRGYLVDQVRGVWDSEETLAVALILSHREWRHLDIEPQSMPFLLSLEHRTYRGIWKYAREWYVEDKADGRSTVRSLKSKIPGMDLWKNRGRDKEDRLRACVPWLASGAMLGPHSAEWWPEYIAEMINFPNVKHDDQVDTTTMALEVLLGVGEESKGDIWAAYDNP